MKSIPSMPSTLLGRLVAPRPPFTQRRFLWPQAKPPDWMPTIVAHSTPSHEPPNFHRSGVSSMRYWQNGLSAEVLRLYEDMRSSAIKPDSVILCTVLSACGRAGKFGFYEFFKKYYSDLACPENAAKYKTLISLAGSAPAEVIADVALCPFEAVKVRVQHSIMGRKQQWDPGGHFEMSQVLWSSQHKQWDPGKFIDEENFYNLEDKVDFEGVVMI